MNGEVLMLWSSLQVVGNIECVGLLTHMDSRCMVTTALTLVPCLSRGQRHCYSIELASVDNYAIGLATPASTSWMVIDSWPLTHVADSADRRLNTSMTKTLYRVGHFQADLCQQLVMVRASLGEAQV
jgi:hypothetical protein